ncbi:MAG TPA: hypothetical protein VIK89_12970, partial [Cytophagaceae bacterium]
EYLSIGPMLHLNVGKGKANVSFGVEAAYWNYKNFPYSIDFGFDAGGSKFRLYSEVQTGVGLAGIAAGPVLEFNEEGTQLGFQGSFWANYFWGFDLRFRKIGGESYIAPGTYVKLPIVLDGDGKRNRNSGGGSFWDDDD